jgi:intracellular multiplication protein IcmT
MARTTSDAHWRDSARTPRFYFMDSLAAFPLLIFFLHVRLWTFFTAIGIIFFLVVLEKFKFTLPVFKRWLRSTLAGPLRVAKPWWRR